MGVYRAQGYRLIKRAWHQIKLDIDESGVDRQELLSWSIQTLTAAAGQAMQQKNPGAVVSAIRHPPARPHDWHWLQLPPRKWKSMMGCYRSSDKVLNPVSLVKQIESNIGWFGLERQ